MRAALLMIPLLLAACHAERDDSGDMIINHGDGRVTVVNRSPTWSAGTGANPVAAARSNAAARGSRVIDLAGALTAAEEQALAKSVAESAEASGRAVIVLLIEPAGKQSLEQVGWAIGQGASSEGATMILVDPGKRQVRVEGDLTPADRALVAVAIRDGLAGGRVPEAIGRGLVRHVQLTS